MNSLRGQFLIASPHLGDPNFAQSVVFMVEHHAEGAMGLVINRPTEMQLKSFWEHIGCESIDDCPSGETLWLGGPVEGYVMCLHEDPSNSEGELIEGVHFATLPEHLGRLVRQHDYDIRVFWGYAGWGAGQLESELRVGGWLTVPATKELVFHHERDDLWKEVVHLSGENILRFALKIEHFPADPGLN